MSGMLPYCGRSSQVDHYLTVAVGLDLRRPIRRGDTNGYLLS
jgi:hypothetical protein